MAVPRVAPIGPCGPFVKSNCFIFLLKMHGWILTKYGGIILMGQGFKVVHMVHVAPMGGPRRGPQGPKLCKFQTSFSRSSLSRTVKLCKVEILFRWRIKVGCGTSQGGPNGPHVGNMLGRGPLCKSNCSSTSWRNAWCVILTKLGRNHPQGAGDSKVFIWYMWPPWGPGGGPQGPKLCKFQTSSPDPVKVEQ